MELKNVQSLILSIVTGKHPGAFHLEAEASDEYARHLCAEALDPEKQIWVCPGGRPNHYWDCEVLCFAAAEVSRLYCVRS